MSRLFPNIKCKKSPRLQAISLVEAREQHAIEASVNLNLEKRKLTVKLPFMFNPIPSLKKKHGTNSNYKQANHIYRAQCRKPDKMKEGMRKVHQELVEKGFMVKLETMSPADQWSIKNAEFQHYHPWNIVENENSLSTPMCMCVDPTVTGLNQTLAKGGSNTRYNNQIQDEKMWMGIRCIQTVQPTRTGEISSPILTVPIP